MSQNNKWHKGLMANIIAPGLGQFVRRRYFRGMIFLCLGLVLFAAAVWAVAGPMTANIRMLLDGESGDIVQIDFPAFKAYAAMLVALWLLSYADLLFVGRHSGKTSAPPLPDIQQ